MPVLRETRGLKGLLMLSVDEEQVARITEAIARLIDGRTPDLIKLPPNYPDNEIRRFARQANQFIIEYASIQPFLFALSRGELDYEAPPNGRMALLHCAKNLQANLRHLTWKTQQVAKGDFSQRVDFMGEFSKSFNMMVEVLAANRAELMRKNRELETVSQTDPLTGLLNRRGIGDQLRREIHRTKRSKRTFAIMMADIDHFKRVNDTYGHDAGDAVLVAVAGILQGHARGGDLCARWGGEEFLTALVETDLPQAVAVAERARLCVASAGILHDGAGIPVTISTGVSIYHEEEEDVEVCIKRSDVCMYRAKESGRNQSWFQEDAYTPPKAVNGHVRLEPSGDQE